MFKNDQIIITSNINKKYLLQIKNSKLSNYKIYSITEFNKLFFFDYSEEASYYIMNKYNVKYEISKIYLDNMTYIEDKLYNNTKLSFLSKLKQELLNEKLIKINNLFLSTLINKDIIIYNLPPSKEIEYLIRKLSISNNVSIIQEESKKYTHTIYELNSIEDEVEYVANSICKLLKDGIDISKIYISNLDDEYKKIIKRIFPMFGIPFSLESNESIYGTFICTKFFELYNSDLSITVEELKKYINSEESEYIYNQIINVINKYTFENDKTKVIELIKYDLKNTKLLTKEKALSIHEVDFKNKIFNDDEYVFVLSFNQGILPSIKKDESYLTDKDRTELQLSITVEQNNLEKIIVEEKLNSIKNLIITFKRIANSEEYTISSLNEKLNYKVETIDTQELTNSDLYNKLKLTSLLDEYYKYGTNSDLLSTLNHHYDQLPYNSYSNVFTGINKELLKDYLNNELILSYSSLDKYYKCPFSYYIGNVLKLNIYEETFYQSVGTLFHAILEKCLTKDFEYDSLWNKELENMKQEWNSKEKFFLSKLKDELKFIIDVIQNQEHFTNLHNELHEEKIEVYLKGNISIKFIGFVDKIKYKENENDTIVAIIDYKTGNPNLDLSTIPYGIGMQLPIYLYLAKNSKKLKNIKVAGFYLQKILNNEVSVDKPYTYEQLKKKNLLLQGYSNEDQSILSEFDTSYADSNMIKGMKLTKDHSYAHYTKVLSSKEMDMLTAITENKIHEGASLITNAEFNIAPKKIAKENYGCKFCQFQDICFHTNDDVVELEPLNIDDILERPKKVEERGEE